MFKKLFGKKQKNIKILSPIEGEVLPIEKVNDPAFSSGMLGNGIAIKPTNGRVVSPVNGKIITLFTTKHAVSISTEDGVELLIHIGLDTVKLEGEHFTSYKKDGDIVNEGDLIIEFDLEEIKNAGYDIITPVLVCNSDSFTEVVVKDTNKVKELDELIDIVE